jgi:GDP-mannose 6-dehydrogenase
VKIVVFGLGYVGSVTAACLAHIGHDVVGVDVNPEKVQAVLAGRSLVYEPGLEERIAQGIADRRLTATVDPEVALPGADVAMICVGTPSQPQGGVDLSYVERVIHDIGRFVSQSSDHLMICIRSTIPPGSHLALIESLEREFSLRVGDDYGLCINPEFLREGSAIKDFEQPPLTLIGEWDSPSGDLVSRLYSDLPAPVRRVSPEVAQMVKYAGNAFHALKVVFANEIGQLSQSLGVDGRLVMEVFAEDTKLNISSRYLKPAFAYGGSCLGKDLRALVYLSQRQGIELPVLSSIQSSNDGQIARAVDIVLEEGAREATVIGLSFKPGTDDLRESPLVDLVEQLLGRAIHVRIFDRQVSSGPLLGANKDYVEKKLPHLNTLLHPSLEQALAGTDAIIYGQPLPAPDLNVLLNSMGPHQSFIDLVGLQDGARHTLAGSYRGIAW